MANRTRQPARWNFRHRTLGHEHTEASIVAVWEAHLDPISDDYTPSEISAPDLFTLWARRVSERHPNGLVPIYWFVDVRGETVRTFEYMPFQLDHLRRYNKEDFLSFFSWPTNPQSGRQLNWLNLPVVDKLWRRRRADKGGFVQEATGWKPSILQPFVYLPSLERALNG